MRLAQRDLVWTTVNLRQQLLLLQPVQAGLAANLDSSAALAIPKAKADTGLAQGNQFVLDGRFAHELHYGGAYWSAIGDGKDAKTLALSVCEAMFGLRYGEVTLLESGAAWTPWFKGIAWDLTEVLFDKRLRKLWVFAVTDTD